MLKLKYETLVFGELSLHLCMLSDRQQFSDDDGEAEAVGISSSQWPLFGVVWSSGHALAEYLLTMDVCGKRILEVGCGIAVGSLVLNRRGADITAMDYHPEVSKFLERNVELNGDPAIKFVQGNWNDELPELGEFDVIVGSDLLYEERHVEQLAAFVVRKLALGGQAVITDPGRGFRGRFARKLEAAGFDYQSHKVDKVQVMVFSQRP
ncbi:MAG: putative nicotinamide N-methyase [Patiriisocius sp.]